MSKQSSLSDKLAAFSKKVPEFTVKSVTPPETSADFLTLFESNSAAMTASSNVWTIDVFPSQVTVLAYIMSLASTYSGLLDYKHTPKLSTATITAYMLSLYQGFFLLHDMYVRPSTSSHAQLWLDSSARKEFADFLLSLPVPSGLEIIFSQLFPTTTDRTRNVFFIPSAAGFSYRHFYGRFFPVSIFTHLHDIAASLPSNSPPATVFNEILKQQIFKVTSTTTFTSHLADYFGYDITTANATFLNAKFHQLFTSVFNPVLFRDYQRRSQMSTIDLAVPTFTTSDPNAYDMLFSYTAPNIKELKIVLQSVATAMFDKVPSTQNLGKLISDASGNNILSHGYSDFAVPTWIHNATVTTAELTRPKPASFYHRAQEMTFLAPGTLPTANTDATWYTLNNGAPNTTVSPIWPLSLVMRNPSTTAHVPALSSFLTIDEDNQTQFGYPRVLVLDISGSSTIDAHLATLSGKIIESLELDGTTIEHPNVFKSLGMQNCIFSDSLIPYNRTVWSTRFKKYDTATSTDRLPRPLARSKPVSTTSLPAASFLTDRTKVVIPNVQHKIRDTAVPAELPGFTYLADVNWLSAIQSFIGFRTATSSTSTADTIPGMLGHLFVWSPYSYTSYEDDQNEYNRTSHANDRRYFLTNLRSLFGTDYNLTMVDHPLDAMPAL
jgi:hypothetical protein